MLVLEPERPHHPEQSGLNGAPRSRERASFDADLRRTDLIDVRERRFERGRRVREVGCL
jgi:hypothetical protein